MDEVPVQKGDITQYLSTQEMLSSKEPFPLDKLRFRDPGNVRARDLHENVSFCEEVVVNHPKRELILHWVKNKVDLSEFLQPFKGTFKGTSFDSAEPPSMVFRNHASCKKFASFVSESIVNRVKTGVKVWGEVGKTTPPNIVLPLTVEPSKPRLC